MFLLLEDAQERSREYLKSNGRSEKRQTTLLESMTPGRQARQRAGGGGTAHHPATSSRGPGEPSATGKTSTSTSRSANFYDTTSEEDDDYGEETKDDVRRGGAMSRTPTAQPTGAKRKRSSQEDLLDELSSGGEEEWVAVSELSTKTTTTTGRSTLGRRRDAFVTPSAMRVTDVENGMATPSLTKGKSVKKVLFKDDVETSERRRGGEEAVKRQRLDTGETSSAAAASTSTSVRLWGTDATISATPTSTPSSSAELSRDSPTPTPRNTNSAAAAAAPPLPPLPPPPPRGADPANLTREVMDLLRDGDVAPAVRDEVRRTLEKHANQAKGYERGRDAARRAVKEAEDRAAGLLVRVEELERSRRELRAQLMSMWDKI